MPIKHEVLQFIGPNGQTFDDLEYHAYVRDQLLCGTSFGGGRLDDLSNGF